MRLKKISAIILSVAIFFQTLSFTKVQAYENFGEQVDKRSIANKNEKGSATSAFDEDLKQLEKQLNALNDEKKLQESVLEEGKDYRLIVELQGEPVISEAIDRGLDFKELDESIIEEATERIEEEQRMAISDLSELASEDGIQISTSEELPTYSVHFNGFVVKGQKDDIERLKQKPYVKNVYVSQEYERPQLKHSNVTLGSSYAWNTLGYKGENMVIAIIDTGVDYTHEAMKVEEGAQKKHDRQSIERLISEHGLKGKYFTEKVPYGYNYYDHNHNTFDSYGSMHGMHVAGISAANSSKTNVKGVAPNAQILAMKVFSDDVQYPTTFTDVWLKALDDAIKLKADVINMSLGAPAGILSPDGNSLEEHAIAKAKQAGILIAIAAGNDGHIMTGNFHRDKPNAENPDTALIASPSLFYDSFSVASTDNSVKYSTYMYFNRSDASQAKHKISITKGVNSPETITATPVDLKEADEDEYQKHGELSGKIIMIKVDEEKQTQNAQGSDTDAHESSQAQEPSEQEQEPAEQEQEPSEQAQEPAEQEQEPSEQAQEPAEQEQEPSEQAQEPSEQEQEPSEQAQEPAEQEQEPSEQAQEDNDQIQENATQEQQDEHDHDHEHKKTGLLEKIELAKSKNPSAIVLYSENIQSVTLTNMLNNAFVSPSHTIALIGKEAAQDIITQLEKNPDFEITLSARLESEIDLNSGRISHFSSWGPSPDLRIKPEISAPGGNIYSTIEDDRYRSLSGTSMASPHVAGAAAIMKQALKNRGISDDDIVDHIKLLLMNTALPVSSDNHHLTFVRQQGAGLMQLDKALKTKVNVKATGEADRVEDGKLELGELDTKSFDYSLSFENTANRTKRFKLKYAIIHDSIQNGTLNLQPKSKEILPEENTVFEIEANASRQFDLHLDFSNTDIQEHQFVEGFILLEDLDSDADERVDLSLPFLGFYGDWEKGYAIDAFEIKEANLAEKRRAQMIINKSVNSKSSMFVTPTGLTLPIVDDIMYFSPNSLRFQQKNLYPSFGLRLGVLRNLDSIEYSILDPNTRETLKVLGKNYNVRKINRLASRPSFVSLPESQWNGTIDDYEVKDGDIFLYQIKANLNNGLREDAEQIYQYKIALDSSVPEITDGSNINVEKLSNGKHRLQFKVQDSGSGLQNIYLQSVYFIDSKESQKRKKEVIATPELKDGQYDTDRFAPRYKQAVAIKFIDPNDPFVKLEKINPSMILKLQNGRLDIPEDYFTRFNTKYVYCDIRGHYRDEIEISIDVKSYEEYLNIYIHDQSANALSYYIRPGRDADSHQITFDHYYINLEPNGAIVSVNQKQIDDFSVEATGKSRVSIAFPQKDHVLTKVKLSNFKNNDMIIMDKTLSEEMKRKYNASYDEFSLSFDLDSNDGNYEVTTWTQRFIPESEMASISFEGFDFSKFKGAQLKIASEKNLQDVKTVDENHKTLKFEKSTLYLKGRFNQKEDIAQIKLVSNGKPTRLLEAIDEIDFYDLENTYLLSGTQNLDFSVKFKLKDDAKFSITYGALNDFFSFEKEESSNSNANTNPNGNTGTNANTGSKYPIIVLQKPALLEIKTERDLTSEGILIEGFVGHVKDDLQSLTYTFVDEYGNPISEQIEISKSQIKKEEVHFYTQNKEIYHGTGYVFRTYIKPKAFHVNLRLEATTTNKKTASIVRRLFFDDQAAKLSYHVLDRKLSDEFATIKIRTKDNSFKINLFKNNSLIENVDLSKKSYESKDAVIETEIKVPLKPGQNKIELKAVDLSLHESVRTLYIYRIR